MLDLMQQELDFSWREALTLASLTVDLIRRLRLPIVHLQCLVNRITAKVHSSGRTHSHVRHTRHPVLYGTAGPHFLTWWCEKEVVVLKNQFDVVLEERCRANADSSLKLSVISR